MCGIFAVFASPSTRLPDDIGTRLERALDSIQHRGPDARGTHVDPQRRFAVGHVRLSVIDIAACSNQPFWSACGKHFIVFNGEIYNYLELRNELESEGAIFRTKSDTEVLLQLLMRRGPEAIARLNGMWAFVYGDIETGEAVVSRDRWGVKPLHTMAVDGSLVVCSEAKGIFAYLGRTPPPDHAAIGLLLKYSVGGENESSWFEGVKRFPKAAWQRISLKSFDPADRRTESCWEFPKERTIRDLDHAVHELDRLLTDSIKLRLRSDVPVGLSLSGGLDSSMLAWLIGSRFGVQLEAYTAWYSPIEQSELPMAQRIASMFGHRSTAVAEASMDNVLEELSTCVWHLDSGHSSPAIIPYLRLCRRARQSLTVMLEGQGADELLGGYALFSVFAAVDHMVRLEPRRFAANIRRLVHADGIVYAAKNFVRYAARNIYERQAHQWGAQHLLSPVSREAVPEHMRRLTLSSHNFDDALQFWHRDGLTTLLQYGDAISMSVNLETRCPFLDYRLVDFGFRLHEDLLIDKGFGKFVMRKMADGTLPADICWKRRKEGFTNSSERAIRGVVRQHGLPKRPLEIALDLKLFQDGVRSPQTLERLPDSVLFRIMSTLLWAERFYGNR